jgi:hypothetical protein
MAKIQPVNYPFNEVATDIIVYVQPFSTSSNTCSIQYVLTTSSGKTLLTERYQLTEEEFYGWGQDNSYLDEIAAARIPVVIIPTPEPTPEG